MQVYALRYYNFMRFGESDNSVVLDLSPEDKVLLAKGETTIDKIYDRILADPIAHVEAVQKRGLTNLIGISGIMGDNYDFSNGVGKSTLLEGICYAHYEQVVRRNVNTDKTATAGLSVVTKIGDPPKYPAKMKESWVEEIFEESGKIYRIKRGREFKAKQTSSTPLLEFICYNDTEKDGQAGHKKKSTNESIASVTSMDYDLFVNSVLFGQSDAGKFLTGTDKTRKEMIVSLLKLEDVIGGCLDNIRKRKNLKDKDIDALNAQIDVVDGNLKVKEPIEVIEQKIQGFRDNIKVAETQIEDRNKQIEKLSSSEVIKVLADIKANGKKVRDNQVAQKAAKETQVKEWNNLSEEVDKKVRIQEDKISAFRNKREEAKTTQIKEWTSLSGQTDKGIETENLEVKNLSSKLKETQDQIAKLDLEVKQFDIAAREEILKKATKARELKPKLAEAVIALNAEKEKIVIALAPLLSEEISLNKELNALKLQRDTVKGDDFVCDKCKSKVNRKHIEDEISRISDLLYGHSQQIKQIEMDRNEASGKLTKTESNLARANELMIQEGNVKTEIQGNENKKVTSDSKKATLEDYNKRIEISKAKITALSKQKSEYVQKINDVSVAHDLETNKLLEEMNAETLSLSKQKEGYLLKGQEISKKYDAEINKMQIELDELASKYTKAKKDAEDVEGNIKKLRSDNEDTSKSKSQYDSLIGASNKEIENIRKETETLKTLRDKHVQEVALLNRLILLDDIFGLEGIQTRIVKKYLPLLNNYIKEILDVLSNGDMGIKIYINDKGKVDILITGGMADNFTMCSGGEKTLCRLSVSIGLALLSFTRCAHKPKLILLDEIFSALDVAHEEAVFRLIKKLEEKFSRILIISHRASINDRIEHKILIEKGIGSCGLSKIKKIT